MTLPPPTGRETPVGPDPQAILDARQRRTARALTVARWVGAALFVGLALFFGRAFGEMRPAVLFVAVAAACVLAVVQPWRKD